MLKDARQRIRIAPVSARSEDDLISELKELRMLSREDVVASAQARICSDNGKILTSHGNDRAEKLQNKILFVIIGKVRVSFRFISPSVVFIGTPLMLRGAGHLIIGKLISLNHFKAVFPAELIF